MRNLRCNHVRLEIRQLRQMRIDIEKRLLKLSFFFQSAVDMVKFQLRHGNDLLAMDSIRDCDVSFLSLSASAICRGKAKR